MNECAVIGKNGIAEFRTIGIKGVGQGWGSAKTNEYAMVVRLGSRGSQVVGSMSGLMTECSNDE